MRANSPDPSLSLSGFSESPLYSGEDEMKRDDGYAVRDGKFWRGSRPVAIDPEVLEHCLASGIASGALPIPARIGDRILRIATFIAASRRLSGNLERRNPDGPR
jgi:hypothetical protein